MASDLGLAGFAMKAIMRSTLQKELASFKPPPLHPRTGQRKATTSSSTSSRYSKHHTSNRATRKARPTAPPTLPSDPRWHERHGHGVSLLVIALACALFWVAVCVCMRRCNVCSGGDDGEGMLPVAYAPLATGAGEEGIVMGEMVSAVGGAVGGIGAAVHGAVVGLVPSGGCDLPVVQAMALPAPSY